MLTYALMDCILAYIFMYCIKLLVLYICTIMYCIKISVHEVEMMIVNNSTNHLSPETIEHKKRQGHMTLEIQVLA